MLCKSGSVLNYLKYTIHHSEMQFQVIYQSDITTSI